jgi:4-amino-4-deoxy-L-arabinose transferase-like glycosyltransferase
LIDERARSGRLGGDAVFDRIALAVLVLTLAARVAYLLAAIAHSPVLDQPMADSRAYVDWARAIASGHWSSATPFYRAPLYPYLIAPFYAISGRPEIAIAALQTASGVVLAFLAWRISRRLYGPAAGVVSLVLLGFFGPIAAQETKILGTSAGLLLGLLALWRLLSARGAGAHFVAGLLLGLGALARPTALLAALGTLLIIILYGRSRASRTRPALALLAGITLAVIPATLHNLAAGEFVAISSNGGMTFFHGNNEENRDGLLEPPRRIGAYGNAVDQERLDRQLASHEAGRPLSASQSSAYWWGEGIRYLIHNPSRWASLWCQKIVRYAGVHDYADNYSYGAEKAQAPLLGLFFIPFPLILIPAVAGLFLRRPRGREEPLLLVFAALGLLTCVLFYVGSRYRSESVPALAILAGRGVVALRGAEARRRWAAGALTAGLIAVTLIPAGAPAASQDALAAAQWAAASERNGHPDDALRGYLWAAHRYGPLDVAWARAADLEEEAAGVAAGIATLDAGIAAGADGRMLRTHRAVFLARAGREAEAESDYRVALRYTPGDPLASQNLAALLVRSGRDREAQALLDLPDLQNNAEALYWRGLVAVREGRWADAGRYLDASIAAGGGDPSPGLLRAVAWIREGRAAQAKEWVKTYLEGLGLTGASVDLEATRIVDALGSTDASDRFEPSSGAGAALEKAWMAVRAVRRSLVPRSLR